VLLHESSPSNNKQQQLIIVGLGKPQITSTWGENGFRVRNWLLTFAGAHRDAM